VRGPVRGPDDWKDGSVAVSTTPELFPGLILGPSHSMQPDVPVENILTLYETAKKYGKFPAETV